MICKLYSTQPVQPYVAAMSYYYYNLRGVCTSFTTSRNQNPQTKEALLIYTTHPCHHV